MFRKPNPPKKSNNLSQFGLIDIPDLDDVDDEPMDLSDDDIDLEAELAAITGGNKRHRPRKPAPVPSANLDAMIAESLKDVPSDEDASGDDDDPDILNELKDLGIDDDEDAPPAPRTSRPAPAPPVASLSTESSTISLLQDRISNYTVAEKNAKANGESSRARRFGRGLKTLNDLLKQAKAGKPVNDLDIPPPVPVGKAEPPSEGAKPEAPEVTTPPSPPPPAVPPRTTSMEPPTAPEDPLIDFSTSDAPTMPEPKTPPPPPPSEEQKLSPERQQGLQMILKRKNEFKAAALASKQSGDKTMALEYLKVCKQFDVVVDAYKSGTEMDLNELPTVQSIAEALRGQKVDENIQKSTDPAPAPAGDDSGGLITASTLEEALRQRLAYFQQQESKAKEEGNSSKARRMARIVKQYLDAVRLHSAGKPVPTEDLPTPPGFAALPDNSPRPAPSPRPASHPSAPAPAPPAAHPPSSRYEKQIALLLIRQKQFKEAAIKAKKEGDIAKAKEYLRASKGFDSMIEAARGGLTVDIKSLPPPPRDKDDLENTFDIISSTECDPSPSLSPSTDSNVCRQLLEQLSTQLKVSVSARDRCAAVGCVADANRFENLAVGVKQDMDLVTVAFSTGQTPKFHYESRKFSIVQCNTDLNENDLELTIVRGIAYNVPNPKEVDTYVKFEFPYPQEAPISDRTATVKDTNSPTYNAVFPLAITRGNRACLRVFKRHAVKLEVYSKGGWFRGDALLGAAAVKLAPLEQHVTLHDSFQLMDGRRPAGGSIEIKLRVRTPLLQQEIETTTHRWLVIDN